MTDPSLWARVDHFFEERLGGSDPVLDAALERSRRAGLPGIQVTPGQGRLLWLLTRAVSARTVLEVGTLGGYSTIWLGRALPPVGRLVTLEVEPEHAEVARENLTQAALSVPFEVRLGDARESLRTLAASGDGPFDLVFLDANKDAYPEYLDLILPLTHPGSLLIADNVVRGGRVADASSGDASVQGVQRFTEALGRLPNVDATAVQTVGAKGYDGFILALLS